MDTAKRQHVLIAGTGRSGTSFLVRYLTELGMDTHLARRGAAATWYDEANAGFEDTPLIDPASMPDVIKSPWSHEFITELLAHPDVGLRVAILPMRDLGEVAVSRSILERQEIHARAEWMILRDSPYETWGYTPGGVVFSLSVVDQARLLAVGFHQLVQQLVEAEVPIVMPSFPRLVEDAEYLFRLLRPWLPEGTLPEAAQAAHAALADMSKVRVGPTSLGEGADRSAPGIDLDREALRRELVRVRAAAAAALRRASSVEDELGRLRAETDALRAGFARADDPAPTTLLARLRRALRTR